MTGRRWLKALAWLGVPFAAAAAQAPGTPLQGTVTDSVRHRPLAGATVVAERNAGPGSGGATREFLTRTDSTGHFAFATLAAAVYLVTVEHPWLDSTGLEVPPQTADLREGRNATLSLATPSGATIRSTFCPSNSRDTTTGLVEGFVHDAESDLPVAGAKVLFEWNDFAVDGRTGRATPRRHTFSVNTTSGGTFLVCGLPGAEPVLMQAQTGEAASTGAVELDVPQGGVLFETLRLPAAAASRVPVSGEVRRAGTGLPVAGAHVHVFGTNDEVVTADDGSFHLAGVPIGTQSIEVTALGLRPRRYALDVRQDEPLGVNIALAEMTRTLDTVRTIGTRAAALRDEFDARARHGPGQYITEEMIKRTQPWFTSDLIRYVHGFEFRRDTVFSTRGEYDLGALNVCRPLLLIDGNPANSVNEVLPTAIHGIEIYAASMNVPIKYSATATATGCGAIFIWTK